MIETRALVANGISQHVALAGSPRAPAVLLVHGLGWDGTLWRPQVLRLASEGWYAIAPDLRGMGATAKPDQPCSIAGYAADLVALLDVLGVERTAVLGFSLGSKIAIALSAAVPDRVAAAILACGGAASSAEAEAGTEAMLARAATLGAHGFAAEQAAAIFRPNWAAAHPDAVARFIGWRAAMDQPALVRAFRASYGVDLRPALAAMDIPARAIAAENDAFVAVETMRDLAMRLPRADLVVIPDCGHMASIEQPAAFDAAVFPFLAEHWPAFEAVR